MKKLFLYTRGKVPVYRLYAAAKSVRLKGTEVNGIKMDHCVQSVKEGKLFWAWYEDEIIGLGRKIWDDISSKEAQKKHVQKIRAVAEKAIHAAEEIRGSDLLALNGQELIEKHQRFFDDFCEGYALTGTDIDAIDLLPADLLKEMIKKELAHLEKKEVLDVISKITSPIFNSYVSDQEKAMLTLLIKMKEAGISLSKLKDSELYAELKQIIEKYWWTSLGWENAKLKTTEDYIEDLKHYDEVLDDLPARLAEIDEHNRKLRKQRKVLVKKHDLSEEVQFRLELFDEYAVLHDLRKEMQMRVLHGDDLFLQEFSARLNISVEELEWYRYEEIYSFLLGEKQFNHKDVEERKTAYFMSNDIEMLVGKEAADKNDRYFKIDLNKIKEIKGTCSSPGFAKGKVKVCNGYKEALAKIKIGDVLVTGMTLPDYVPAMRRAAAIITDEGGITCHAAIISRELGKPCITGCQIASDVLKDDDVVEVDADNGMVKVIEKKVSPE